MKYLILIILFIALNTSLIFSNVSKTFRNSIPYDSSANYKWSTWDYLTNPYLYSLNQKNTVSIILTGLENFSAASSFLVYGHPIYLAAEIGSFGSRVKNEPLLGNAQRTDTNVNDLNIKFLLGSIVYKDYGLGFYVDTRNFLDEQRPINTVFKGENKKFITKDVSSSQTVSRNSTSHLFLGLEFGKYSEAIQSVSFSLNLSYNQYGGKAQETEEDTGIVRGENDAPFFELIDPDRSEGLKALGGTGNSFFGSRKRELRLNLLTWYVLNDFSNAGISFDGYFQPSLEGRDSSNSTLTSLFADGETIPEEIPKASISAYRFSFEPFYDLDFKHQYGVFRITPSLFIDYATESAKLDTTRDEFRGGTIDNEQIIVELNLTLKYHFYLNSPKTFSIFVGWQPRLNLYHKLDHIIQNIKQGALADSPPPYTYEYEFSRKLFHLNDSLKNISLGFQYVIDEKIFFNVSLTPDSNTSKFSLNQLDFGIDYII